MVVDKRENMQSKLKVLNLYAGIGGNRKLWPKECEVTAIENNKEIAKIYRDFFPNDKVIVTDAHQYLLEHYKEFDFIWASPPCPTHSKLRKQFVGTPHGAKAVYPDMNLYQEIIFLDGYFKGKWIIENVIGYYEPLIKPFKLERHYFWSNFIISKERVNPIKFTLTGGINKESSKEQISRLQKLIGFDLSKYQGIDTRTILRNCIHPKLGIHIFNYAFKEKQENLTSLTKEKENNQEQIIT